VCTRELVGVAIVFVLRLRFGAADPADWTLGA